MVHNVAEEVPSCTPSSYPIIEKPSDIKKRVARFYKKAFEAKNWISEGRWYVVSDWGNGDVILEGPSCRYLSAEQKDALSGLYYKNFVIPDGRTVCRIYATPDFRPLTLDELWIPDIKKRAIDLGFKINDSADPSLGWGWGFFGTDAGDAVDKLWSFNGMAGLVVGGTIGSFKYVPCASVLGSFRYLHIHFLYGYIEPFIQLPEPLHDTSLSIAITDEAGNPITESVVGETVYIAGQLRDIVDSVALQGASIALYKNGVATADTDTTDASGIYSIPYTITEADAGLLKFKVYFAGT